MSGTKILHVIDSLSRGGAERALVNLLPALQNWGYDVEVAALREPYDLADELEARGIPVHRLQAGNPWNFPLAWTKLLFLWRHRRFHVLHAHLFFSGIAVAMTRLGARPARRVVTFHNLAYDSYPANSIRRKALKLMNRLLLQYGMDAYVAVSHRTAEHYTQHLGVGPITVIPNALAIEGVQLRTDHDPSSVRACYLVPADAFLLLSIGRLVHEKGHRFLIDAIERLRARGLRPMVLVIGDGPLAADIAGQVVRQRLGDQILVRGSMRHDEILDLLRCGDAVVLSSTHEGFPLTPVEAMALCKPVIATRVGGLEDLVEDGVSGLLVPASDPESLANAIARLMTDATLRMRIAQGGRERAVSRFGIDVLAEDWALLYERVVG